MRVCFYTLGCKVNLNETGALEQLFRANGFTIAQEGEAADVFIVAVPLSDLPASPKTVAKRNCPEPVR